MRYLFVFLLLTPSLFSYSSDTLSRAQVFNFNVGDTFDYKTGNYYDVNFSAQGNSINFSRIVITGKYYSPDSLTLFLVRTHSYPPPVYADTLGLTNLNNYEILLDTCSTGQGGYSLNFDSNSMYNGRMLNGLRGGCAGGEVDTTQLFAEGLGEVYFYSCDCGDPGYVMGDSTTLIYYSKGAETWGIPYYIENGSTVVHFTPIPETCAVWNDVNHYANALEEIRTRNRIAFNGHTYVEMIYSANNFTDAIYTSDTLIGYFRNDTAGKRTYFYHTLSDSAFFYYDFNQIVEGCEIISIDQILIGGQLRTRWTYGSCPLGYPNYPMSLFQLQYVEGVGGLNGLVPVIRYLYENWYNEPGYGETEVGYFIYGTLTCFSVCGQTLYPNDSSVSCPTLTGIAEIKPWNVITIFPNPGTTTCTLQLSSPGKYCTAAILDITGREVLPLFAQQQISTFKFSVSSLEPGLYFVEVTDELGRTAVKKLIKE